MSASAAAEAPPASAARFPSWEWLWRGNALREARTAHARARATGEQAAHARARARIAAEVAASTLTPTRNWATGDASHLAAALYAEFIAWSLRALAHSPSHERELPLTPPQHDELVRLIASEHESLAAATADPATLDRIVKQLLQRSFEAAPSDVAASARELGLVAERLFDAHEPTRLLVERAWLQRTLRLMLVGLILAVSLSFLKRVPEWRESRADLARGKPWRASSAFSTVCPSPEQSCGYRYFFHTNKEASPWVEIDLGQVERVSKVRVKNRVDCCQERAVPLVVEVSTDHRNWQEVRRQTEPFKDWTAGFAARSARWVRLRVAQRSILHLHEVRVLK